MRANRLKDKEKLARRIRQIIQHKGISQKQVFIRARVPERTFYTITSPTQLCNPSIFTIARIASALDVSIDELLHEKNECMEDKILVKYLGKVDAKSKRMITSLIRSALV